MTMAEGDLRRGNMKFVRSATIDARPPPLAMSGALGGCAKNLLSTPFNIALTILIGLLLAWVNPAWLNFC